MRSKIQNVEIVSLGRGNLERVRSWHIQEKEEQSLMFELKMKIEARPLAYLLRYQRGFMPEMLLLGIFLELPRSP